MRTYLESLVLKNPLDGGILIARRKLCLKYHAKRPIPNDLALRVGEVSVVTGLSILDFFSNDLCS